MVCKIFYQPINCMPPYFYSNATFERLLAMLATCQTAIAKNYLVYQMNKRELENYRTINEELSKTTNSS